MSVLTRIVPYAIAVVIVGMTHWWAFSRGEAHTKVEFELKLQKMRTASAADLAKAERKARDIERDAAVSLAVQSGKYAEEARHAKVEIDVLRADLRASRVRLSVPVAACAAGSSVGTNSATAGGLGAEARAELMPETASDLVSIAADGDAAVRQLNRLIDAYNALRDLYNAESR